ncbi:MAG: aldehyde dehydrogenase family protein, partial [Pseudomonadota bacterium]
LEEIKDASRNLRSWMKPKWVAPTLVYIGTSARVRPEPRGVCLIIAPWNYPLLLALGPLISCLAAGNSAILKPSEMTPATSALMKDILSKSFPPDLVSVFEGGVKTSQALLDKPFDHIFFTGSPKVGKIVMEAASKNLATVTLELGGKSPTIVGPNANIEDAAKWIAFGKFSNAGQTCVAPDHVFVHQTTRDQFVHALRERIINAYGKGANSKHLARIVNEQHSARLVGMIQDATSKGATLTLDGEFNDGKLGPTLIEAVTPEMAIDQEEIFGPVLPIMTFNELDEVIARINARPKPLSLYIFERNQERVEQIIAATSSGNVGVNLTTVQFSHTGIPFGGVNDSGIGSAHGYHGFRAFSHERSILKNRYSFLPWVFPPYTDRVRWMLDKALRLLG